jgi:hypothetical protein
MCLVLSSHYDIGPVYASYIFIFRQTVFILRQTEFILRQTVFILRQNRVHSSPKPLSIAETRVHASPNRVSNKTCSLFPSVRRDVLSARNLLVGAIPQYWLSLGELLYWPSLGCCRSASPSEGPACGGHGGGCFDDWPPSGGARPIA